MASAADLNMENAELKAKIEDLVGELEDKDNQLTLSAQFGKELLEHNNQLARELEEIQDTNLMQTEELRQENYSLKLQIEASVRVKESFSSEMEAMKEKLQENAKKELIRVTAGHDKKVNELQKDLEALQTELEKGALVSEQLQEKIAKQEQMLAEAHKYSKQLKGMGALETELEDLKEECILLRFKNDELKITLADVKDEKEQLLFDQQGLLQKIGILKENVEERTSQGKTWFDALQDSRQSIADLQMEISVLRAEALNKSHKEKGNSLFGEVEDKRLALEQKYTALTTKYDSLHKTHQIVKRQFHQLKTQILPMLQMASNQADSSKIKRLEAALSQSRSEIQGLYVKIKDLESENEGRGLSTRLQNFHDAFTDFKDQKNYVKFLQNEMKCLKETIADLQSKNKMTTVKLLAETDKRRETECLLHTCEVKKEKLEHELVRLRLKLDELKIKLQQENKTGEQGRELPSSIREKNRSIWKDASLFTKPEIPQAKPKDTSAKNRLSAQHPENNSCEAQVSSEAKENKTSESTALGSKESLQPKKAKPVGRVVPLHESNYNEEDCPADKIKPSSGEEQERTAESNCASTTLDTSASEIKSGQTNTKENPVHERTEKMATARKDTKKDVHVPRELKQRRVIHVKKDAGSKNECQQQ